MAFVSLSRESHWSETEDPREEEGKSEERERRGDEGKLLTRSQVGLERLESFRPSMGIAL